MFTLSALTAYLRRSLVHIISCSYLTEPDMTSSSIFDVVSRMSARLTPCMRLGAANQARQILLICSVPPDLHWVQPQSSCIFESEKLVAHAGSPRRGKGTSSLLIYPGYMHLSIVLALADTSNIVGHAGIIFVRLQSQCSLAP